MSIGADHRRSLTGEHVPAHFFLSYARADDDGYVGRFSDDLVKEVRRQSGISEEEIGFRDLSSLRLGTAWSQELTNALSTAKTFLALCSPSYFTSELCGQEWATFASRMEGYRATHGTLPPTLLPILWVPVAVMPEPVQQIQYDHEELGYPYAHEGLYHLLRLRRYRDDYLELVRRIALRIVDVAKHYSLEPLPRSFDVLSTPSIFHAPTPVATSRSISKKQDVAPSPVDPGELTIPPRRPTRGGPRHVHFVVVAAASRDLVDVRNDLQHYGPEPFDWAPYRPELDQRISVFAQNVAANQDLTSGLAEAYGVLDLLDRAAQRNELVVLLVDVWTTKLESYRRYMIAYDLRNEPSSAVMVPWNNSDRETAENSEELRGHLHQAFPRNTIRGDDLFRTYIATSEAFRIELMEILVKAQSRVFRNGPVGRRAGNDSVTERPVLELPNQKTNE
jgi:FxsC-like protein